MPNAQVAARQEIFDRAFPFGLVAAWEDRQGIYLVPRVVVTGMSGSDPVVWLPVFSGSDKVLGPLVLLSYTRVGHKLARVQFQGVSRPMTWYAGVSRTASRVMSDDRRRLVELAPQGGEAIMHEIAKAA